MVCLRSRPKSYKYIKFFLYIFRLQWKSQKATKHNKSSALLCPAANVWVCFCCSLSWKTLQQSALWAKWKTYAASKCQTSVTFGVIAPEPEKTFLNYGCCTCSPENPAIQYDGFNITGNANGGHVLCSASFQEPASCGAVSGSRPELAEHVLSTPKWRWRISVMSP